MFWAGVIVGWGVLFVLLGSCDSLVFIKKSHKGMKIVEYKKELYKLEVLDENKS